MRIPNPPRMKEDFDIEPFTDGLKEIIPDKITEILEKMEQLEAKLLLWQKAIKRLKKRGEIDDAEVYFWSLWAELEYTNYFICQKWLIYWLNLYEKIPREKPMPQTDESLERLNRAYDIQRAKTVPIENFYQDTLYGTGSRLAGKCPFHEERTPSFFIFTNNNTFHCFGACGAHGDVIDFIMQTKKLSFNEALKFLL